MNLVFLVEKKFTVRFKLATHTGTGIRTAVHISILLLVNSGRPQEKKNPWMEQLEIGERERSLTSPMKGG